MMYLQALWLLMFLVTGGKNVRPSELMGDPCQCVPPHMCIDNDLAVNGQGMLDIRLIDGECDRPDEICCDSIIDYQRGPATPSSTQAKFNGCGFESPLVPRIVGDQTIVLGEVPWTAAVLTVDKDTKLNIFRCGCSLIHPQVALTAGHCVAGLDTNTLIVRAGEVDTEDIDEMLPHQQRSAKEIVIHKYFQPLSLKNDIALIFLKEPFSLSGNVRTICLPSSDVNLVGTSCIASGWGADSYSKGKQSTILKKVMLPLISRNECVSKLRNTRLGPFFSLHRSFLCAGGENGRDTCIGDGGSPLVCPIEGHPDRFVQIGIVSWGIGCGSETPGVYVNINLFSKWIDDQLNKRQFDVTAYKYR